MKRLMPFCDFLFGAFLIGGAPLCFFLLTGYAHEYIYEFTRQHKNQTFLGYDADLWGDAVSCWVFWGLAILAFVLAIRHRKRHRILPGAVLQFEIGAGVVGAVVFTIFYALFTRVA